MKIFSFNSELNKITGVQKVLLDIHKALSSAYSCIIVGTIPYENVNQNLHINKNEYKQFINPFMFYKSIVFVHERKFLLLFWLLNHFLFQQIKVIYVHHNILYGWRFLSIMPKTVVSISNSGTENLIKYFHVPSHNIHKIYNCVQENINCPIPHKYNSSGFINILYPARINDQKRQLEIVERLKGKLDHNVKILFAGIGPHYEKLKEKTEGDNNFQVLGFRNDVLDLLCKCDYMMLFSRHEGLPITLIEATMCGTPIICNDVGGNLEIAHKGENAFVTDDWTKLVEILNSLSDIKQSDYLKMSKSSREIYEKNFTFEIFRDKYLHLIKGLFNSKSTLFKPF